MKESTVQQLLGCEANGWTLPKPHHIYAKTFRHTTNLTMQNNLAKRKNSNNTSIDGPRFTIYRTATPPAPTAILFTKIFECQQFFSAKPYCIIWSNTFYKCNFNVCFLKIWWKKDSFFLFKTLKYKIECFLTQNLIPKITVFKNMFLDRSGDLVKIDKK